MNQYIYKHNLSRQHTAASKIKSGFTIVELLIVIVVIAILAAITIVAYNGIQQNARKSYVKSDASAILKAMELYKSKTGTYPACPLGTSECGFNNGADNNIREQLLSDGQLTTLSSYNFNYVRVSDSSAWALRYRSGEAPYGFSIPGHCKFGVNMTASWYASAPDCMTL